MRKAGIYPQYMAILEGLSSQWALAIVLTCSPDTGGIMDAVERSISKFERFKIQCPKSKQVDSVAENRTLVGRFNVFIELRQIVCRTEYSSPEIDFLSLPSNWVPYNWFLHQWRSTKSGIIGMVSINYYICFTLLLRLLQLLPRHDSMAMQRHFDAHGILRIQMTKQWVWGTKLLHLCS